MNSATACSSGMKRTAAPSPGRGRRMKRSSVVGRRISAFICLAVRRAAQLQRDREAEIGDERERMRRIDRQRRQHREDVAQEVVVEPGALLLGEIARRSTRTMPLLEQRGRAARSQRVCWSLCQRGHRLAQIRASCSARACSPSGLRCVMPSRTWPARPATRTMKNSSRLLAEIDRKRSRSSSGWLRFDDFLQHAPVELQPGELAVDKPLGHTPEIGTWRTCADRLRLRGRIDFIFQSIA